MCYKIVHNLLRCIRSYITEFGDPIRTWYHGLTHNYPWFDLKMAKNTKNYWLIQFGRRMSELANKSIYPFSHRGHAVWRQSKARVLVRFFWPTLYRPLITFALSSAVSDMLRVLYARATFCSTQSYIPAKICDSMMLGCADSEYPTLISRDITFEVFKPLQWPR